MKIYTKTGDKGETGYIGGRVSKSSERIELVGNLDELNACLGLIVGKTKNDENFSKLNQKILKLQSSIFSLGAVIAGGKSEVNFKKETEKLEKEIDAMDKLLEPLKNFILPGGSEVAAHIHLSRTICRRAERQMVRYFDTINFTDEASVNLLSYLNRLSDYLFVLARFVNKNLGEEDVVWVE